MMVMMMMMNDDGGDDGDEKEYKNYLKILMPAPQSNTINTLHHHNHEIGYDDNDVKGSHE